MFREVLVARRQVHGDDHRVTLATRHGLAAAAAGQGRRTEAQTAFRQLLDDQRRVLGDNDPDTIATFRAGEALQ